MFEIGSVTKIFTGTLLALAVERGATKLDGPASKYLPAALKLPAHDGKEITLQDLATQRSSLPTMPENARPADTNDPFADYTDAQLGEWLGTLALDRDPGSQYEYSNVGFGVLGQALCHKAGSDYETLVRKEICDPSKLPNTTVTLSVEQRTRLAYPYDEALDLTVNWELPALAGAGALRSNTVDMARYVAANLGLIDSPLAKALAATHEPREPGRGKNQIGFAWQISPNHGKTLTWHNGGTAGYHAFIGLDLAAKRGVVILANSANSIDDIGFHLLDLESALTKPAALPFALASAERDPYQRRRRASPCMAWTRSSALRTTRKAATARSCSTRTVTNKRLPGPTPLPRRRTRKNMSPSRSNPNLLRSTSAATRSLPNSS